MLKVEDMSIGFSFSLHLSEIGRQTLGRRNKRIEEAGPKKAPLPPLPCWKDCGFCFSQPLTNLV